MTDTLSDTFSTQVGPAAVGSYFVSWTGHVQPTVITLVFVAIGLAIAWALCLIGMAWIIGWVSLYAYGFLVRRSLKLYADENGVWVFKGILPWAKGTSGVKWRDLDEAVFFPGFFGWVFKSYQLRIGHRFTKSSEIVLGHIRGGDTAVQEINQLHIEMVRNSEIDGVRR